MNAESDLLVKAFLPSDHHEMLCCWYPKPGVPDLHFLPELEEHFLRIVPQNDQVEPKCHEGVPRARGDVMGQDWEWSLEVSLDFTWIPSSRCPVNLTCVG